MIQPSRTGTLVVTACDEAHYHLAADLIDSLRALHSTIFKIGFINIGSADAPPAIRDAVDIYVNVPPSAKTQARYEGFKLAYLNVKPSLPHFFPLFSNYVWLDSDCWVQNEEGIAEIVAGASDSDVAIHPECDPHYFWTKTPSDRTVGLYRRIFAKNVGPALWNYPMVNAGVFAARHDSILWDKWHTLLDRIRDRHGAGGKRIYFSDQIPLHYLIFSKRLSMFPIRARNNWQLYSSTPSIDIHRKKVVVPTPPHEEINIIHMAGATKDTLLRVPSLGREISFRYSEIKRILAAL